MPTKLMFLCSHPARRWSKQLTNSAYFKDRWPTQYELFLVRVSQLVADELMRHVTRVSADDRHSCDPDSRVPVAAGLSRGNTKAKCRRFLVRCGLMTNYELLTSWSVNQVSSIVVLDVCHYTTDFVSDVFSVIFFSFHVVCDRLFLMAWA